MGGLRSATASAARRIYPGIDEARWNRQMDRTQRHLLVPPVRTRDITPFTERPRHLVVVPQEGPGSESWGPGHRNIYYEAYQSARERWGDDSVSVLDVTYRGRADQWQLDLVDHVHDTKATHVLTHIETDPNRREAWTWDLAWSRLHPGWDGALLGVMFDSAFTWISAQSRRLARMSPHFVVVDICMPMDGVMVRGRPEVGPVNMPVSEQSLAMLNERLTGVEPRHEVSFIGALYPYRLELIEGLRARGIDVVVNPHRFDETRTFAESRANQPGWLDYMAGLAESLMTINFSRSSAGDFEQLKTRVLEATLAGTLLLTDDRDRTRLFFEPDEQFGFFPDAAALPGVIEQWMAQPDRLDEARASAQVRAREIALTNFWNGIDSGLQLRGLPTLSRP
jgi:hypothetical protein